MSQWCCQLDGREIGPLSFQELAALAREGKVTETTRVRRRADAPWEPAWAVIGLFADDGTPRAEAKPPDPVSLGPVGNSTASASAPAWMAGFQPRQRRAGPGLREMARAGLSALAGMLLVGLIYRQAYWREVAFPAHRSPQSDLTCWFPLLGACTPLECEFLYFDVFALAAAAAWVGLGRVLKSIDSDA